MSVSFSAHAVAGALTHAFSVALVYLFMIPFRFRLVLLFPSMHTKLYRLHILRSWVIRNSVESR